MKAMSDIRVFVTFPESAVVFAGESLECKITFKNISSAPGSGRPSISSLRGASKSANGGLGSPANGSALGGAGAKAAGAPLQLPTTATGGGRSNATSPRIPAGRTIVTNHRPSLSLNVSPGKPPASPGPVSASSGGKGQKHRRSISIVSLGSEVGIEAGGRGQGDDGVRSPPSIPGRQGRGGHVRSTSMQAISRRSPSIPNGPTPTSGRNLASFGLIGSPADVVNSYDASAPVS